MHTRMEMRYGLRLHNGVRFQLASEKAAADHLKQGLRLAERTQNADDIYVGPALAIPSAEAISTAAPTYDVHTLAPVAVPRVSARDYTERVHTLNEAVDLFPPSAPSSRPPRPTPNRRQRRSGPIQQAAPLLPHPQTYPQTYPQPPSGAASLPAQMCPSSASMPASVPMLPLPAGPPMAVAPLGPSVSSAPGTSMAPAPYMAPMAPPMPYVPFLPPGASVASMPAASSTLSGPHQQPPPSHPPTCPYPPSYSPPDQPLPSCPPRAAHSANASHPVLSPISEEQQEELDREGEIFSRSTSNRSLASMQTATSLPPYQPTHKQGMPHTWSHLNPANGPYFRPQGCFRP
ncbi:unnamed protein product [Vitrella brassicaformis CCMP3155]|uniref:Uncharacterized protein n=2 Tax=Vitrella brassicaformis TaxID=1169539 RepID=A0A0G4EIS8_VITBC|nr:unnamed protein product [Vitrella brassicaformis CCMP3155]|eukprot:CEL95903.1 unnamed protein product [Vitrella brassicaformis CCMP3155]